MVDDNHSTRLHVIRPGPDTFEIAGQAHEIEPHYYPQCGLDIYLMNGFKREILDGEETITIENLDGLWTAIGLYLVSKKKMLQPKEIKFLRHHMDLTQAELARILRTTDQTIARWEKGHVSLDGPADVALRTAFLMSPAAQPDGRKLATQWLSVMKDLTDSEEDATAPVLRFCQGKNGWLEQADAAA